MADRIPNIACRASIDAHDTKPLRQLVQCAIEGRLGHAFAKLLTKRLFAKRLADALKLCPSIVSQFREFLTSRPSGLLPPLAIRKCWPLAKQAVGAAEPRRNESWRR